MWLYYHYLGTLIHQLVVIYCYVYTSSNLTIWYSLTSALSSFSPKTGFEVSGSIDAALDKVTFNLKIPVGAWFGIGFNASSMTNGHLMIVNANQEFNPPLINDTFSAGHGYPKLNTENIYQLLDRNLEDGTWILSISRPIEVPDRDRGNETLPLDSRINMIYAFGQGNFARHQRTDRGVFSIRINSKSRTILFAKDSDPNDVFYKVHGIIMYITWSILSFFAIVSGRYMRHLYNFRMVLHASVGTLIMSNTVIIVVLALEAYPAKTKPKIAHNPIGILVMVLSILQFIGGMTVRQSNANLNWKSKWAFFSKLGHQLFGFMVILISNFQVVTGLINYESPVKNVIYVHFAVYALILVGIEVIFRWRYKYKEKGVIKKGDLPFITTLQLNSMVRGGQKVVLFNNHILDVESFMDEHPGTRFVIAENIGRDIGKYFYGAYSVEADVAPHTHSTYAATLIEKLTIGKLRPNRNMKESSHDLLKSEGDGEVLSRKFVSIGIKSIFIYQVLTDNLIYLL